jgi:hypothetical protein
MTEVSPEGGSALGKEGTSWLVEDAPGEVWALVVLKSLTWDSAHSHQEQSTEPRERHVEQKDT